MKTLYESIFDIDDNINGVKKSITLGAKYVFGNGYEANGSRISDRILFNRCFDWNRMKNYLKHEGIVNPSYTYNDNAILKTCEKKFNLLLAFIFSLIYPKDIEGDPSDLYNRDDEFSKFLENMLGEFSTCPLMIYTRARGGWIQIVIHRRNPSDTYSQILIIGLRKK